MKSHGWRLFLTMSLLLSLVACGGGGGDDGGFVPAPQNASAGGFWAGSVTADGMTQDVFGLVSETRQFHSPLRTIRRATFR